LIQTEMQTGVPFAITPTAAPTAATYLSSTDYKNAPFTSAWNSQYVYAKFAAYYYGYIAVSC